MTGSHKGLGYAIARQLAQKEDIQVIITSRNLQDGITAQQRLASEGLQVDVHTLDVTSGASVKEFITWSLI
ncbi:hypothetical protein B9G53_02605 [Pseudanabaena sp. SR411]|uniref:SDR family NAD(P)-dependent oxidoreductase n=1 Tax=Pseudanabaena sp. SR411 TaxID=1980935 RepID=UPI000B996B97|nr:hypothetical protein B9G53_02605 [Pseudanabaena sp. SR411]